MLVPRKKAHRSFVNASRCLARVKQVREAFATRPDCRYNDSPFLWLWSCYTISYRINWRAYHCGYAPIETHSWPCFLRSLTNDYVFKKYYKNLFFVIPHSYSFFLFLLLLTSTRGIRHVISPSEILYTTSLTKRDVSFACGKIEKSEKWSHSIFSRDMRITLNKLIRRVPYLRFGKDCRDKLITSGIIDHSRQFIAQISDSGTNDLLSQRVDI